MNCVITPLHRLEAEDVSFLYRHATKPGSEFNTKILSDGLGPENGVIAVVRDQGEIVGWARTEPWIHDVSGEGWDTLEAFTRPEWRRRGVCRYAVAGLVAMRAFEPEVAVFSPRMTDLCRHLKIASVEYHLDRGMWCRVR